jgi:uncharacterized protein YuzE
MKFNYDKASDSLYIELAPGPGAEAEEVAPGIVVDYDAKGRIVGLDIEDASKNISLSEILVRGFLPKVDLQPGA